MRRRKSPTRSRESSPVRGQSPSAFLRKEVSGARRSEVIEVVGEVVSRHETRMGRERRERQEAERKEALYAFVMARHRTRLQEKARLDALRARVRKLQGRLQSRPGDLRSLRLLAEATYQVGDDLGAALVIKRALPHESICSPRLYLMLGRCHLRRFRRDGTVRDLEHALEAFKSYMRDPESLRAANASAAPYMELSGLLLRLGRHQAALDTLAALMASERWQESYPWMMVAQYAVAQIYLQLGMLPDALDLYQRLMLCPLLVSAPAQETDPDHCILLSTRLLSVLLPLEVARVQQRLGQRQLAMLLLRECFERQDRYRYTPEQGGDVDIRFGHTHWDDWIADPLVYRQLAALFRREGNVIMAAEMFGVAAEVQGRLLEARMRVLRVDEARDVTRNARARAEAQVSRAGEQLVLTNAMLQSVLDRAECLSELAAHEDAEFCCDYAFETRPSDIVVVGRAAKCCLRGAPDVETALARAEAGTLELPARSLALLRESRRVLRAVAMVMSVLQAKVARRRRAARLQLNFYATRIQSVIRMNLTRNRTAELRLAAVATVRIGHLCRQLRHVWRTGRGFLDMYAELWNLSIRGIQHLVRMFIFRRRVSRVSRGMTLCKRVWRGQKTRRQLRALVERIQADIDAGTLQDPVKDGRRLVHPYYPMVGLRRTTLEGKERLSAGVNLITDDANLPVVAASTIGSYSVASKARALRLKAPPGPSSQASTWFSMRPGASSMSFHASTSGPAASASFCSQEELEMHVAVAAQRGEDVPCLLHVRSVLDDATVRWVPFGLMGEEAVMRLLTCTSLVLTAQSLALSDVMRLCYCVRRLEAAREAEKKGVCEGKGGDEIEATMEQENDAGPGWAGWAGVKSLLVQGTRIGQAGVSRLLSLGFAHMHTLSLGRVGLTPAFAAALGASLTDLLPDGSQSSRPRLAKLYIAEEPHFGNEGTCVLMRALQFNSTLRILAIRACRLSRPCVEPTARFLALSTGLEVLHLSDNPFTLADARVLVRAVANKGLRGVFRSLHLEGLGLGAEVLREVHGEGLLLGVAVVSPEIGYRAELRGEQAMRAKAGEDHEDRHLRNVGNAVQERLRRGGEHLDPSRREVAHKEVHF